MNFLFIHLKFPILLMISLWHETLSNFIGHPLELLSERINIRLTIDNELQKAKFFEISLNGNFNWITPFYYVFKNSDTSTLISENEIITYKEKQHTCSLYTEPILLYEYESKRGNITRLNTIKFPHLYIIDSANAHIKYYDRLCFGSKFNNLNYSITHQLYEMKWINKLSFTYTPDNIYFGSSPDRWFENTNRTRCRNYKAHEKYIGWGCKLETYSILNTTYHVVHEYTVFEVYHRDIFAPVDVYSDWKNNFFETEVGNGNCNIIWWEQYNYYACKKNSVDKFTDWWLKFEGFTMEIKVKSLFKQISRSDYKFVLRENRNNPSEWSLGLDVIYPFNVVFDYEEDSIELHNYLNNTNVLIYGDYRGESGRGKDIVMMILICFIGGVWIVGIVVECAVWDKMKKKN